jgi:hypothetical protein
MDIFVLRNYKRNEEIARTTFPIQSLNTKVIVSNDDETIIRSEQNYNNGIEMYYNNDLNECGLRMNKKGVYQDLITFDATTGAATFSPDISFTNCDIGFLRTTDNDAIREIYYSLYEVLGGAIIDPSTTSNINISDPLYCCTLDTGTGNITVPEVGLYSINIDILNASVLGAANVFDFYLTNITTGEYIMNSRWSTLSETAGNFSGINGQCIWLEPSNTYRVQVRRMTGTGNPNFDLTCTITRVK